MNDRLVLCADIGSSSLKAALIGPNAEVLAFSRHPFLLKTGGHAAAEWLTAFSDAVTALTTSYPHPESIAAVCISGNGPTIVGPGSETLLWSDPFIPAQPVNRYHTKSLFIPRLLLFREKFPGIWNTAATIFSGPEFLVWKLTGSRTTILPEKRYTTAYWTTEELTRCGFTEQDITKLPPFQTAVKPAGFLNTKKADLPSLPDHIPVFCGGPDFIAALIGTNTLHPGRLCDRAGSSEGLNLCTPGPLTGSGIRTLPSVLDGMWTADILIPDSGRRFADYRAQVERRLGRSVGYEELVEALLSPAHYHSFDTETGIRIMNEVASQVGDAVKKLTESARNASFPEPERMVLTGGQSHNTPWTQLKCDTAGIPVDITTCADAELTGDNICARVGLGEYPTLSAAADNLVRIVKTYTPKKPRS